MLSSEPSYKIKLVTMFFFISLIYIYISFDDLLRSNLVILTGYCLLRSVVLVQGPYSAFVCVSCKYENEGGYKGC